MLPRRFFFHPDFRGTVFLWGCTHITRSPKLLGCLDFTDKSVALSTDAGGLPGRAQTSSSQPGPGHAAALEQSCCWHGHRHPCRGGTQSPSRVWCGAVSKWQKAALAFKWAYLLEQLSWGKSPLLSFRGGDVLVGVQPSSPWQPHSVFSQLKTISLWAGKRKANSEKKTTLLSQNKPLPQTWKDLEMGTAVLQLHNFYLTSLVVWLFGYIKHFQGKSWIVRSTDLVF